VEAVEQRADTLDGKSIFLGHFDELSRRLPTAALHYGISASSSQTWEKTVAGR
jgi:hypothetical protein